MESTARSDLLCLCCCRYKFKYGDAYNYGQSYSNADDDSTIDASDASDTQVAADESTDESSQADADSYSSSYDDGYDYSSASICTVQDGPNVLAAVTFATDRGDTHISLDRIKDGTQRPSLSGRTFGRIERTHGHGSDRIGPS